MLDQINAFLARPLMTVGGMSPSIGLVVVVVLAGLLVWKMK